MQVIENYFLLVEINPKGAELKRIYHKKTNLEYLWNADPSIWAKSSPVLFPIVGTLKENKMLYHGKVYEMGRHGFARDREFAVERSAAKMITFLLHSDESTLEKFPFPFEFRITYQLVDDTLQTTYTVINPAAASMLFSVGAHPAFRIPLTPGEQYTDYELVFEKQEHAGRWMISPEGLIGEHAVPLLDNTNTLPLTHELFYKDAVVLKDLHSRSVRLKSKTSPHGLKFDFPSFPFLGIWSAKDADFVCIEPWCGIADSVNATQLLEDKEGIESLPAGETFTRTWSARFY